MQVRTILLPRKKKLLKEAKRSYDLCVYELKMAAFLFHFH
jgi:hypothetical protein